MSCFNAHLSQHYVHPNALNVMGRVPDLPRSRLLQDERSPRQEVISPLPGFSTLFLVDDRTTLIYNQIRFLQTGYSTRCSTFVRAKTHHQALATALPASTYNNLPEPRNRNLMFYELTEFPRKTTEWAILALHPPDRPSPTHFLKGSGGWKNDNCAFPYGSPLFNRFKTIVTRGP